MSKLTNFFFASCLLLTAYCSLLSAQTATATLSGTVVDANGAAVPGASVTITDTAKGFERKVTTSDEGSFTLPLLRPSNYTLLVARGGFASAEVRNVNLNVGDQKLIAVELKVSPVKDEVVVTADAFLVNNGSSVATTMDETFVQNLPLNGRSFSTLVLLTPGVTITPAGFGGGFGQFSVNGQRTSTNYFTVDGVSANTGVATNTERDLSLAGGYPAQNALGGTSNLVSQDALQEFKVQTSTYTAENGRQPGAQVQVVTKSGQNEFHGTAFNYFRNEALDARGYFNTKPNRQTPLRQNLFGGTLGGRVFLPKFGDGGPAVYDGKNKTFFFFSYEGHRIRRPVTETFSVPSLRVRGNAAAAVRPIINAFSLPTGPEIDLTTNCPQPPLPPDPRCNSATGKLFSGIAPFTQSVSNPGTMDATSVRIDHTINSKHTIFGRFNEAPSDSILYRASSVIQNNANTRSLTLGATSSLSSRVSNEFRANFTRSSGGSISFLTDAGGAVPVDPAMVGSGFEGEISTVFQPSLTVASLPLNADSESFQRQFNLIDNLTWVKAGHVFKFGVDYRSLSPVLNSQPTMSLRFGSEAAIAGATVSNLSVRNRVPARPRFINLSFFAQDTWKLGRRLTLDLGLRYDLNPAPTEADGQKPAVVVGIVNPPDTSQAQLAPPGTPFYKTFFTAFAPRLGAAYQLRTKHGSETVLRGGFGVFYDLGASGATGGFPLLGSRNSVNRPFPLSSADVALPQIVVPTTLPIIGSGVVVSNAEDLKLPYTLQWNLALEQSLAKQHVVSVSYVGSAGRRLLVTRSLNNGRVNPNFAQITFTHNGPDSDYHSMQVQYRARFKDRMNAIVNYTWSHSIDSISTDTGSNLQLVRGSSSFDIRHNLSAAIHYELPKIRAGKFLNAMLHGWGFDAIVYAQSGRPLDLFTTQRVLADGTTEGVRPNLVAGVPIYLDDPTVAGGRRFNLQAFSLPPTGQQGNLGRNALNWLPIFQTDVGLSRTITLTEKLGLQLKGEAFNVFNHPLFGAPSNNPNVQPNFFGVPTTTLADGLGGLNAIYQLGGPRSIQLSAKLIF